MWQAVERSLATDARDLPFTLTYLVDDDDTTATLAASSNVRAGDPIAPGDASTIDDADVADPGVIDGATPQPLIRRSGRRPVAWPRGPWQKPPTRAMVLPIAQQGQTRPAGVFIAGLNPYRPVDAEYESFIALYVGQLAAGLANAQALRGRAPPRGSAGADRPGEDDVLLERQPRAADAADADARAGRRMRWSPMPPRPEAATRSNWCYRNGVAAAEAGERAARLLAYRGRPRRRQLRAGRSRPLHGGRGERLPLGDRAAPGCASSSTARRSASRPTSTARCGRKIVFNLISNAFKFTFEARSACRLRAPATTCGCWVRDTGAGFRETELPRIFERFHRVEGAIGRTHEGTGIGLALVQELVKLHGGTIDVRERTRARHDVHRHDSARHRRICRRSTDQRRPHARHPPDRARDAFVDEARRWSRLELSATRSRRAGGARRRVRPRRARRERILLADDNADMRAYLKSLLGRRWAVRSRRTAARP